MQAFQLCWSLQLQVNANKYMYTLTPNIADNLPVK